MLSIDPQMFSVTRTLLGHWQESLSRQLLEAEAADRDPGGHWRQQARRCRRTLDQLTDALAELDQAEAGQHRCATPLALRGPESQH